MSTDIPTTNEIPVTHAEFEAEVTIAADGSVVWEALTSGIGAWWPHTFEDHPVRVVLEPSIGGRFFEQFDDAGAGALYAHVTYLEPGRVLRISGPMGIGGAAIYVKTYRLEPAGGGTTVRTSASLVGAVSPETVEGYRVGGVEVLRALRAHVEDGGG
jgi:uncharacterized protein YndB with AHSA1/START domain